MSGRGSARLIVRSERPLNAETPLPRLRGAFLTPQADFYVRTHGDIPEIDAAEYRLRVEGGSVDGLELGLADLRARFPRRTVTATLQCAGNRRGDLQTVGETSGDPWDAGAIGNGAWGGVALSDLLRSAGLADPGDLHVAFRCRDLCEADGPCQPYEVSIPARKAMDGEVLLASELNGEPLTPAHGFPLRVVVPGYAGVRSAKWLDRITVQAGPSGAHWQARDYRLFPPGASGEDAVPEDGLPINDMPLNSAICDPVRGGTVRAGRVPVRGYATA